MRATVFALYSLDRTVDDFASPVDDADVIAQSLRVFNQVGAQQDRATGLPDVRDDFLEHALVDRIEPAKRLVQHDDVGFVEHRGYELQLLLHPLRKILDSVVDAVFKPKPLEPSIDPGSRRARRDALELGQERQHGSDFHGAVQPPLFWEVADPVEQVATDWLAKNAQLAGVGLEDSEQQPNGRRLAGSVGSQQAVGRAPWYSEVELVDGDEIAELLAYADQLDRSIGSLDIDRFCGVTRGLIEHVCRLPRSVLRCPQGTDASIGPIGSVSKARLAANGGRAEIRGMRRVAFLALLGAVVALFAYALTREITLASPLVGHPAPPFAIPYYSAPDSNLVLTDFRGKPVVLNFWASWCLSCRDEAAVLEAGWQRHGPDVAFMGIAVNDREAAAKAFIERYGKTYLLAADVDGSVAIDYGLFGVPETFFIASDGRILSKHIGPVSRAELDRQIAALKRGEVGDASGDPATVTPIGGGQR